MESETADAARALALIVGHINASSRDRVSATELLGALRGDRLPLAMESHVRAVLNETDVETLSDLVRSGAVGYDRLATHAAALLPPDHETRLWLEEHV